MQNPNYTNPAHKAADARGYEIGQQIGFFIVKHRWHLVTAIVAFKVGKRFKK